MGSSWCRKTALNSRGKWQSGSKTQLSSLKIADFVHESWTILEASPVVFLMPYDVSDILGRFRCLGVTSLYLGCSLRASKVDQKVVYNTENSGFWIPTLDDVSSCSLCFLGSMWHLGHLWNLLFAYNWEGLWGSTRIQLSRVILVRYNQFWTEAHRGT